MESAEETWERDLRPKRDELGKAKLEARAEGRAMNVEECGEKPWSGGRNHSDLCGFEGARASEGEGAKAPDLKEVSGDNSLRDPPVPIPNTEVKPQHADSTWLETAR